MRPIIAIVPEGGSRDRQRSCRCADSGECGLRLATRVKVS